MTFARIAVTCALVSFGAAAQAPAPRIHRLDPSPTTVAWGHYDAAAKPALHVSSGDTVVVRTLITSSPERLEKAGVAPEDVEPALREIHKAVTDKGPGGHILTGPIFVDGAEPGDALEVHVDRVDLAIGYGYNAFGVGRGFLPDDFPYPKTRIIQLDPRRRVAHFADGIEVPLHPFFGSIGVAPPASMGRIDSAPPSLHGGNLDNKDLVAGTTLYLPVYVPGGLLEIGDGHAAQGNGEVDITAIETSLVGTVRIMVRKGMRLTWPRAETPTHWIAMGMDRDLWSAAKMAVRQAVELLASQYGLSKEDAYMLASVACDVEVTQLVDGNVGVHVRIPKSIFTAAKTQRAAP
jgi:acetamidase/formamidase